jgi:hypothetical protein
VAAKLLFLVPRRQNEDPQAYAIRLRHRIEEACGKRAAALSSPSM